MKFAKWLMAAASVLLVCACSKNPLAYVEEGAHDVFYFNFSEEMNEDTEALVRQKGIPGAQYFKDGEFLDVDMVKEKAKLAFWKSPLGSPKAAIVLGESSAEEFMDECSKNWKKKGSSFKTDDVTVVKEAGMEFTQQYGGKSKVQFTMVAVNKKTVLVYFGDSKIEKLLSADNASAVAAEIDEKAIWAQAYSGEATNEKQKATKKKGTWDEDGDPYQVLPVGCGINMLILDGDELKEISKLDISDID